MANYRKINAGQSYDTIGREIAGQLKQNSTHEIKFRKIENSRYMYEAYVLESGSEVPRLRGTDFIGSADISGLGKIISSEIQEDKLPGEIRVISPSSGSGGWGIFFGC